MTVTASANIREEYASAPNYSPNIFFFHRLNPGHQTSTLTPTSKKELFSYLCVLYSNIRG